MKIKYFILFCIFSLSCGFSSDDPWDLKINLGDQFSNRERSVYLKAIEMNHNDDLAVPFKTIRFSIWDKNSQNTLGQIIAQYYGPLSEKIMENYITRIVVGF